MSSLDLEDSQKDAWAWGFVLCEAGVERIRQKIGMVEGVESTWLWEERSLRSG